MNKSLLIFLMFAVSCAGNPPTTAREIGSPTPAGQAYMSLLVRFLTGTFEAISQDERLGASSSDKLRQAPFWKDSPGEYWMYAEYAHAGDDDRPFRQRIYRFTESQGLITATIFELPGKPAVFVGEWRKEAPFAGLRPSQLRERSGCAIVFLPQMEVLFNGGRKGEACRGEFPGAHHEHAEFYVSSSSIRTFEDGRDASGKHLSGPTGPSEFRKLLQFPQ